VSRFASGSCRRVGAFYSQKIIYLVSGWWSEVVRGIKKKKTWWGGTNEGGILSSSEADGAGMVNRLGMKDCDLRGDRPESASISRER